MSRVKVVALPKIGDVPIVCKTRNWGKSVVTRYGQFCYGWDLARPLRITYPGAIYHVMNRGAYRPRRSLPTRLLMSGFLSR